MIRWLRRYWWEVVGIILMALIFLALSYGCSSVHAPNSRSVGSPYPQSAELGAADPWGTVAGGNHVQVIRTQGRWAEGTHRH